MPLEGNIAQEDNRPVWFALFVCQRKRLSLDNQLATAGVIGLLCGNGLARLKGLPKRAGVQLVIAGRVVEVHRVEVVPLQRFFFGQVKVRQCRLVNRQNTIIFGDYQDAVGVLLKKPQALLARILKLAVTKLRTFFRFHYPPPIHAIGIGYVWKQFTRVSR